MATPGQGQPPSLFIAYFRTPDLVGVFPGSLSPRTTPKARLHPRFVIRIGVIALRFLR